MDITPASQPATFAAIIVAAGKGLRAEQAIPKQFSVWRGKSVIRLAAERLIEAGAKQICIAIPEGAEELAAQSLDAIENVTLVTGGATRQESVLKALEELAASPPQHVLIHDAARPDCPPQVVSRLINALGSFSGAIPVLPVVDSLVRAEGGVMAGSAVREELRRVQTPQAFHFAAILAAHRTWTGPFDAGDDAQVARAKGLDVALVQGDERLHKLTFAQDFKLAAPQSIPIIRTGTGYDVHRLAHGEELWLCGVKIPYDRGLVGHSDADVALHAVVDAILGAAGQGDIGDHFSPDDPQWRGAASARFIEYAVNLAAQAGYGIGNVDLTIICEAPKIGPHKDNLRARLSQLLGVGIGAVNVKATTTERLGFAGRGEGIAAQAVATLIALS